MKVKISLLLLALLISGCAHYTLAPPERRPIGDLYSVESRMAWSRADEGGIEVWTIDGPLLEALRFVSLKDGDTLIPSADKDAKVPRFRSHMTPNEVAEFFVASLKSVTGRIDTHKLSKGMVDVQGITAGGIDASTMEIRDLRPADFGSLPGFRFDFDFLSKEGLEREGTALGAIYEGRLLLLVYTGTREHYFEKYRHEVEQVFSSVQITK